MGGLSGRVDDGARFRPAAAVADQHGGPGARLKVCHVITRLIVGGAQENTVLSCALLDRVKYDTLLVTGPQTGSEGELHSEACGHGVRLVILASLVREVSPLKDLLAVVALWRLLRRERPHVVHTHSSKAGVLGRVAAWLARTPIVIHTIHGWPFHDCTLPFVRWLWVTTERVAARCTDRLIVVTPRDRDKGLGAEIGSPLQYVVIRSGVDVTPYLDGASHRAAVRHALGIPEVAPVFGSVTRLSPQKDPRTLLAAAALVIRQVPDAYCVIVGDGPLRGELEHLAHEFGAGSRVLFTGIRRDIPALLSAFDVFVLSSLWEGLPRVIPQAMAASLPIVASGVDGVAEVLEDGVSGLLVPPRTVHNMADRIICLLTDRDLAQNLAKNAGARLHEFDLRLMIAQLEALYDELARFRRPAFTR